MEDDQYFAFFIENFGEATAHDPVPEASFRRWAGVLPESLLRCWRRDGWANYGNGRLWTVNPEDYEDQVHTWLEETPFPQIDSYHVFARSSFGDIYFCGESSGAGLVLSPVWNRILCLQSCLRFKPLVRQDSGIQAFFASARHEDFDLIDQAGEPLFERAMRTCGSLQADEMYGFEPALVCGGQVVIGNLRRLKLHPHLNLLRQFAAPAFPRYAIDAKPLARK